MKDNENKELTMLEKLQILNDLALETKIKYNDLTEEDKNNIALYTIRKKNEMTDQSHEQQK